MYDTIHGDKISLASFQVLTARETKVRKYPKGCFGMFEAQRSDKMHEHCRLAWIRDEKKRPHFRAGVSAVKRELKLGRNCQFTSDHCVGTVPKSDQFE
jgi:hypothetical protein